MIFVTWWINTNYLFFTHDLIHLHSLKDSHQNLQYFLLMYWKISPWTLWSLDIQYTTPFFPSGKSWTLDNTLILFLLNLNSATDSQSFLRDSVICFIRPLWPWPWLSVTSVFCFFELSFANSSVSAFLLLFFLSDIFLTPR